MGHPIYPIACFVAIPLVLSSVRSHIRSRNIAVLSLILWVAVLALIRGINAIVWYGNVDIRLLVWCDITTKITIGWTLAIPLTMLCLTKHLESIAANRRTVITERDKRRRIIFESIMCYVVPMIFMAIHYCFQGHRFDIYEDFGCYPTVYATVPSFIFIYIPPFIVSVISMVYTVLALIHFWRRRVIFTAILQSSNSAISQSHYYRLMALAIVECIWDTGLNCWVLVTNIKFGFNPWISWENVHADFSRVATVPWILLPEPLVKQTVFEWWILPVSAVGVFSFFAFGSEAKSDYQAAWRFIKVTIFRRPDVRRHSAGDLPMYIDSPLPVTKLSKYFDEKRERKNSKGSTESPWEKIKLEIPQTQSFSSSNDGYSSSPSSSSSPSLPQKEKKIFLSPVTEPAPVYRPHRAVPAPLDSVPSRNPTPELRVMGPFEDARRPSSGVDDASLRPSSRDGRPDSEAN